MPDSRRHTKIEIPKDQGLPRDEMVKALIDIRRYVETAQVFSRSDIVDAIDRLTREKSWTPIVRRQQTALMKREVPGP